MRMLATPARTSDGQGLLQSLYFHRQALQQKSSPPAVNSKNLLLWALAFALQSQQKQENKQGITATEASAQREHGIHRRTMQA